MRHVAAALAPQGYELGDCDNGEYDELHDRRERRADAGGESDSYAGYDFPAGESACDAE